MNRHKCQSPFSIMHITTFVFFWNGNKLAWIIAQQSANSIRLKEYQYEQKRNIKNSSILFFVAKNQWIWFYTCIAMISLIFWIRLFYNSNGFFSIGFTDHRMPKLKQSDHQIIALVIKLCAWNFHVLSYLCMIEFRQCEIFAFDLLHFHNRRCCPKSVRRNRMI